MRLNTTLIVLLMVAMSAGCSPYLYKSEINKFSTGVNQLAEAYETGLRNVAEDRTSRQRWTWLNTKPKLAPGTGCVADSLEPCELKEIGEAGNKPLSEPIVKVALTAGPDVKVLQDYADSLAAVTNAADREALGTAQAELKQSVTGLPGAAKAGPGIDLFNTITTAILDTRRYQALKEGVLRAKGPVKTLGTALGTALRALREGQELELSVTANQQAMKLGPKLDESTYAARLEALQSTVAALEVVRSANPEKAANDMVDAHNKLADALEKDQGQVDEVITATKKFFDSAKAVREAFAAGADAQKGSQ